MKKGPIAISRKLGSKLFIVCIILSAVSTQDVFGDAGIPLGNSEAKRIIQEATADFYGPPVPFFISFDLDRTNNTTLKINAIKKFENMGLIRTKFKSNSFGYGSGSFQKPKEADKFTIELTERGSTLDYLPSADQSHFAFLMGHRKVHEIVSLEKADDGAQVVYFVWSFDINDLGKNYGFKPELYQKMRGRAKLHYDLFLKKYEVDVIQWSPWEKENWGPTTWVAELSGKKIFVDGLPLKW